MSRNLVTFRHENLLVLRQNEHDPSDQEWNDCMRILGDRFAPDQTISVLVVTDGGSPTPAQRKQLATRLKSIPTQIVVCTDSVRTRFIVSSVALFTSKIRAFSASQLRAAFSHLKLSATQRIQIMRKLEGMTKDVNGNSV